MWVKKRGLFGTGIILFWFSGEAGGATVASVKGSNNEDGPGS